MAILKQSQKRKSQKNKSKSIRIPNKTLVAIIIISILAGGFGGIVGSKLFGPILINEILPEQNGSPVIEKVKHIYDEESPIIDAFEQVKPTVVSILAMKDIKYSKNSIPFYDPFSGYHFYDPLREQEPEVYSEQIGGGTGFIITSDGLILTNKHVVQDPNLYFIAVLYDGTEYEAEVVDMDKMTDLAVLKLKPKDGEEIKNLQIAKFGDSDQLAVGQRVLAIGNALSEYENTVTAGIISAKGREVTATDSYGYFAETLTGLIQTDAAINPGNSGGPLINLNGEVVGINTAVAYQATGIGFAIPINMASSIISSIEEYGEIVRPVIGIYYTMLTPQYAEDNNINVKSGAIIVGADENSEKKGIVPGGPADLAGLQSGDVITAINGNEISLENTLQSIIYSHKPGDVLKVSVYRDGETIDTEITLVKDNELF